MISERSVVRRFARDTLTFLTVSLVFSATALAQDQDAVTQLVVMIRGTIGDAPTAGAGVVIGTANDRLYIATANHVVRQGAREAQNLQVLLKWLPGEWAPARILEHADTTLDLAVIAVPDLTKLRAPPLAWQALTRPDALAPGTKVFPIGYPAGNQWFRPQQPHLVASVTGASIRAEGTLVPGHSGGALVTEDGGIVGLVSNVDSLLGESQRIDRVVEKLTEWGYRVALTWKPAPASSSTAPSGSTRPPVTGTVPNVIGMPRTGTPGSDQRYALRSAGATQGRTSMETLHTEVNGTLSVDGVQLPGPASFVSDMKTETQILRVSNGAVTGLRVTFLDHSWTVTRGTGSERLGGTRVRNPLHGKTVIGEFSGGQWSFSSPDGALSPAEREELGSRFQSDDDALFPSDPVPVGHEWSVRGADQLAALGFDSGGSVAMRLRSIVSCGSEQCAEIEIGLRLADRAVQGVLLRTLKEGHVVKAEFTGQEIISFGVVPGRGNMSIAGRLTRTGTGSVR